MVLIFTDYQEQTTKGIALSTEQPLTNIALSSNGATCVASSEYDDTWGCEYAIDGQIGDMVPQKTWASKHDYTNAWIKINFGKTCSLSRLIITNRDADSDSDTVLEARVEFSSGAAPVTVK
jgi:hypothetical protein